MQALLKKLTVVFGLLIFCAALVPQVRAECGSLAPSTKGSLLHRQSWQNQLKYPAASFLLASTTDDPIVGLWKVAFTAKGNAGIPDGTPIDSALVVWHNDGTEIMNSGRPPQDGNFCLGVWKKTGASQYVLNHFALGNDASGNPAGPTHIVENVFLGPKGNHYAGHFTLDAYDTSGNNTAHIVGVIAAARITVNTSRVF
jgi:hypothetical protein